MIVIAQTYPHLARQLSAEPWSSREFALVRAAWEMAAELFAGAERGSGKPFVDHLSRHRIGCRWAAATLTRSRSHSCTPRMTKEISTTAAAHCRRTGDAC